MLPIHPQYITNTEGKKLAVILPMNEFNSLMEELEELDDIRRYDEATQTNEPAIPLDEAFRMVEAERSRMH